MSATRSIDLRSDTVTQPSAGMRAAMANAPVGDDVYGEDPTVNRLQEMTADLVGTEAALFVPSGTMANQIAIKVHTQPGDEMLVGQNAHNWLFETGGTAVISGVQCTLMPGDGRFLADDVRAARKPEDSHRPPTRMVSVENTHNMAGGLVWDRTELDAIVAVCREFGLATHMDGARLCNAAAASGHSVREVAAGFDTVAICLSKGLGAPVGSLLCGSRELIRRAHRVRKMLGGGMRQAGILAAACVYALENNLERLIEDHHHARLVAESMVQVPGLTIDLEGVHSNIVMIDMCPDDQGRVIDAGALSRRAAAAGVLFHSMSATRIRLVTHLDLTREECQRAADTIAEVVTGWTHADRDEE